MTVVEGSADDAIDISGLITDWRREVLGPDEPACAPAEAAGWFAPRPQRSRRTFLAVEAGTAVGVARMQLRTGDALPGFAPELFVRPDARRRGVGRDLVEALADAALKAGAPTLILRQDDANAEAEGFADAIGATRGFRGLQNRCLVADLDPALLRSWVDRAAERAAGWSLVGWDGRCPDDLLDAFVEVQSGMLGAPVPVIAASNRSAADIRAGEQTNAGLGIDHWVLAAQHPDSGELGGFTEVELDPLQPWLGRQGDTAVVPHHRQLGLGRWLKAAMALRLLDGRPEVTHLETNTAEDNPPMRAINEAMGFRAAVVWQDRELRLPLTPRSDVPVARGDGDE